MNDDLGDRMKLLEMVEAGRTLMPMLPVLARLDGKCFSRFTRGMARPYDKGMSDLMLETVKHLVEETNACCGYTQSDEITLAWWTDDPKTQIWFGGRIQKMVSVLAAECTAFFNANLVKFLPSRAMWVDSNGEKIWERFLPVFDCRVWNVPTLEEGANAFLWREFDATKNSITMAAQEHYSHKELMGKHGGEKQEMLFRKGINFNDYPDFFKRGSYVQRRTVKTKLSPEDLERLPPLHDARKNPGLEVERSEVRRIEMPPFNKVINRVGVIFRGEEPELMEGKGPL